MIGNTDAGAFEVWENVIPMQGRAMAPQVDILTMWPPNIRWQDTRQDGQS